MLRATRWPSGESRGVTYGWGGAGERLGLALPVHPHQRVVPSFRSPRRIDQCAGIGEGVLGVAGAGKPQHAFQDGDRRAQHLEPVEIEGHGEERRGAPVDDVPGSAAVGSRPGGDVARVGAAFEQHAPLPGLHRKHGNLGVVGAASGADGEQQGLPARQNMGPGVDGLALLGRGEGLRLTATTRPARVRGVKRLAGRKQALPRAPPPDQPATPPPLRRRRPPSSAVPLGPDGISRGDRDDRVLAAGVEIERAWSERMAANQQNGRE